MRIMKLYKTTKDPELYYYFNSKDEKLFMFRHKYYEELTGIRKEKKKSGFKTEKAALKALLEVKAQTLRGETKSLENDNLTVGQWLDMWFEMNQNKWKETTRIQREHIIRLHLKPLLGHFKLSKIDKAIYRRYFINIVANKYKPSTIRMWHNLFKIIINAAVDNEILIRNRFNKMELPKDNTQERLNYFTPNELATFLNDVKEHANPTNYLLIALIAFTGMRKGEAVGLQWRSIDFVNRTVSIIQTRDEKGTRSPKTRNSYRTIIVEEEIMNQLKAYKLWCKKTKLANGLQFDESDLVFITDDGTPIYTQAPNYTLKMAIKRTKLKSITVHGLRHTHATILLNEGKDVKVIAQRLGNTPDMIYSVYGHVLKNMEVDTMKAFSASLIESGAKIGAN